MKIIVLYKTYFFFPYLLFSCLQKAQPVSSNEYHLLLNTVPCSYIFSNLSGPSAHILMRRGISDDTIKTCSSL